MDTKKPRFGVEPTEEQVCLLTKHLNYSGSFEESWARLARLLFTIDDPDVLRNTYCVLTALQLNGSSGSDSSYENTAGAHWQMYIDKAQEWFNR